MSLKIRLARGGAKKKPYYRLVVTNSRSPRDSKFIEKVGTYNPLLGKEDAKRLTINEDRVKHWLAIGAVPSEAVARYFRKSGLITAKPTYEPKAKGSNLKAKAAAAVKAAEEAKAAAAAEAAAAKEAPAEAPAAETPAA
jgi:small subunit ribosomal protein S16